MAAKTMRSRGVKLGSALCVLVLLSSASSVSSHRRSHQPQQPDAVEVSYFPNSHNNFGLRAKLSDAELQQQELDVLQLQNDLNSAFRSSGDMLQNWNILHQGVDKDVLQLRRKRAVTSNTTSEEVAEDKTGVLIDFNTKFSNLGSRRFSLNSTSGNPEMFEVTEGGQLKLRDGFQLDYEKVSMRSISFVVHATSTSDSTDVFEIRATLTVTNIDEPPVFETQPQPYLATVRTDTGSGYVIITLVAKDPEGATVHYERTSVSPNTYINRIELKTKTVDGVRQCELRTVGSGSFPEGETISITVSAKDAASGGKVEAETVDVLIGVRPPQFYQSTYQGAMPEKNVAQQTVYKLGTSEELKVEWKTFQQGPVTLSLTGEGGSDSDKFEVKQGSGKWANIVCKTELDYETANPKTQTLTLTAVQRVGSVDLANNISVTVKIEDRNDNRPVFDQSQYLKTIPEDFRLGVSIMDVVARDRDTGLNAQIEYSLEDTQDFEIITDLPSGDPPTYRGTIRAIRRLDFDRQSGPYYIFSVKATDKGTPPQTSTSNILITVTNVNDERPQFLITAGQQYEVQEKANVGQFIAQVQATDRDGDKVRYTFANGQLTYLKFKIDANSSVVTLNQLITIQDDRFNLTIRATDDGSCCPAQTTTWSNETYIYVQVYGSNDNRPDFKTCSQYNPSVDENSANGTSVVKVTADDDDRGPNGDVTYSLIQSQDVFDINPSTGLITVKALINRETTAYKQVTVKATDGGQPAEEGYCTFRVVINDVNDNKPRFDKNRYVANITLGIPKNVPFASVRAYDDDVGTNAAIEYSLPNDGEGKFAIIRANGFISLTQPLTQADASQSFSLTAMAKDEGVPVSLNTTVTVIVNVGSTNVLPPVWDQDYNSKFYTAPETAEAGYVVIPHMRCNSSSTTNERVEFQLVKEDGTTSTSTEFFSLRSRGNNVTVLATGKFDYAKKTEHIIRIRCVNFDAITLITEAIPKVILNDTNNQIPEFLGLSPSSGRYAASVQERKPIGTSVLTVEATDKDSTPLFRAITFSIVEGGENFSIEVGSKENTAVIRTKIVFDRESKDNYFLSVKATDGAPSSRPGVPEGQHNTATVFVNVEISDVNDNPPTFPEQMYQVQVLESTYINDLIEPPIAAEDPDSSDKGKHTYRIIDGNTNNPAFGIRNGLGNLFPLRKLDFEGADKHFLLTVEASDGLHSATTMVNVTVVDVNDNSPEFTPDFYQVRNVTENDRSGRRLLLTAVARDADVNRPNNIRYSLEGSSFEVNNFFSIDAVTGQLYLDAPLDRDPPDGRPNYQFTIKAADELTDPNYGYASVSVMPMDVNDNAPKFVAPDPLEASVAENSPRDSTVVRIQAVDNDAGENGTVVFAISSIVDGNNVARPQYFTIHPQDGIVKTNTDPSNLDRETQDTYRLTIVLEDQGNPSKQTTGTLTVTLSDLNDQPPVFEKKIYKIDMSENQKAGEVIRVIAKDNDVGDNAKILYFLSGDLVHFSVKSINNEGSVQIEKAVDFEDASQRFFNLTVTAQDTAAHTDTCIVEITVLDFNDNAPKIRPKTLTKNISEDASPGTSIATFSATDADVSDINKAFEFSISRTSNPRRHFSIDSKTGEVKVRRRLDRETLAVHELTILAIDKGSPALSGTATLTVIVEDVNDNYPTFEEDYRPVVPENVKNMDLTVQIVSAKDPDAYPYGAPYGFQLADCKEPVCDSDSFGFQFDQRGDGGNGTAIITTTNTEFDREKKKYYLIPIIMWDMRGPTRSPESLTGTNTLTITIGDENDNEMSKGTQNIFVYNYKGKFGPLEIGRVYVEDLDDWDLPDKTFNYTGPNWMKNYFSVDFNTGMVTMKKGVPSNAGKGPYQFTVRVYDKKWKRAVSSTVLVTIEDLTEEAVRNSGATRFKDTSAEEFIRVPPSSSNPTPKSPFDRFRALLADKLNTDPKNVQIISVQDVDGGYTDVRYSVHGSPYYPSSQTDSIVVLNKAEFEKATGKTIEEVPIDACAEEVFEGGCYNYMDITGDPALVNANGTSFVGVKVFIRAREGCRALDFPDPVECSGDYCYHGGTCVKNDFGVLACINCPPGFDGPRCQQLRHSFSGNNYALYPTLEQCEDSETSIEFITTKGNGLLLYNGPVTTPAVDKPRDFISLELAGGLPVLNIDHGSGPATLALDGKDQNKTQVLRTLADGKWHKIDIVRKGKHVEMIVDDCKAAGMSGSETQPPDTRPCRISATSQGENSFLNVATLLQVGGRAPGHTYPGSNVVRGAGFDGCVRNLVHNSKYYDLHYKKTPAVPSGENGCPREDKICEPLKCGNNGICTASFTPQQATCTCKPGWRGTTCTDATATRDLKRDSFLLWRPKANVQLPTYELEIQVMYRTWDTHGVLFTVATPDNTKRVTVELKDGRLQALYNLDNQDHTLLLNNTNASDGFWHVARFKRVMHVATLTLDHGEGRNHASLRGDTRSNVHMKLTSQSSMYGGAVVTSPSGAQVVDRDLADTCIRDVRVNGKYLPIKRSENTQATLVEYVNEQNVEEGCSRDDGCVVRPPVCPANSICVDLWGRGVCRCAPGYHDASGGVCESDCLPDNPCFLGVPCSVENGSLVCTCTTKPWTGPLCNLYPTEKDEPSVGIAGGTIAAIVVSIILAIILVLVAFFLVTYYMRKKEKDDFDRFVVEDDADFDIRENVMFYDEEGAGEEDQNAFDLTKLPLPASETMGPPADIMPRRTELPRGRSRVPDDRPDVGDVLHDRMRDADDDPDAPPHDTLIAFEEEGGGSDAGSLSSLGSSSSDASQDYDYLNDWGPKFAKLADMYGAGQE